MFGKARAIWIAATIVLASIVGRVPPCHAQRESPSLLADKLNVDRARPMLATATVEKSGRLVCASAFREKSSNSSAMRARYEIATRRPWTLLSFSGCGAAGCPDWSRPNASSAIVYDGHAAKRKLGLRAPVEFSGGLTAIDAFVREPAITSASVKQFVETIGDHVKGLRGSGAGPVLTPADAPNDFWTAKVYGDVMTVVLLYETRSDEACDVALTRTALVFNANRALQGMRHFAETRLAIRQHALDERPSDLPRNHQHAAWHLARVEWVSRVECETPGVECIHFCTALLLDGPASADTFHLVTAGHCVPERTPEGSNCVIDPSACSSHNVDIFLDSQSEPRNAFASLPVTGATGSRRIPDYKVPLSALSADAGIDYAFITTPAVDLGSSVPAPLPSFRPLLRPLSPRQQIALPSNENNVFLLSHPRGHLAQEAQCGVYADKDDKLYHTCFTLGGSSGGPLLWAENEGLAPIGIHTYGLRYCDDPDDLERNREWEAYLTRQDETAVSFVQRQLGRRCVGLAVPLTTIYKDYCVRNAIRSPGEVATGPLCPQLRAAAIPTQDDTP